MENFGERTVDILSLPKDVVLGRALISLIGNKEIYIENFETITTFEKNLVIIRTKKQSIILNGRDFIINYYSKNETKITGTLLSINFK